MKNLRLLPLVVALAVSTLSAAAADKTPALSIDQALKIAQDYLQSSGAAADHQVVGLTLEQATFRSTYWYAKWSRSIGEGPRKETGLRIDMDGTITKFVTAPAEQPTGQRRVGARNIR